MIPSYYRRVREFFAQRYHQHVRVDGERAMDTLIGTMLGVLFLAVISASFAGIFMAYTVSTAKATENTDRASLSTKYSTNSLNNLFIESVNGKVWAEYVRDADDNVINKITSPTPWNDLKWNRWTVLSHNKALAATTALNPSFGEDTNKNGVLDTGEDKNGNTQLDTFRDYTFAATRPMAKPAAANINADGTVKAGAIGVTLVSQWGKNDKGIVTIYTSVPKAESNARRGTVKCDWTTSFADLANFCITVTDSVQSVVTPPLGVRDEAKIRWAEKITQYPWTASAANWALDTRSVAKTSKLGIIDTTGKTEFKWVAMFDDLTPGKKVSLEFVENSTGKIFSHTFTPTLEEGEEGLLKVTRSAHGTLSLPTGASNITVYLDTDMDATTANDQTLKLYRFMVYNIK